MWIKTQWGAYVQVKLLPLIFKRQYSPNSYEFVAKKIDSFETVLCNETCREDYAQTLLDAIIKATVTSSQPIIEVERIKGYVKSQHR